MGSSGVAGGAGGGFRRINAGCWYPIEVSGPTVTTTNLSLNEIKVAPFTCARTATFDTIAVECTGVVAGAAYRFCVYADNGNGFPGALLLDAGTVDISAATGEKDLAINLTLPAGLYWVGGGGQGSYTNASRPNVRCIGPGLVAWVPGGMLGTNINYACLAQQGVSGAMPATWPTVFDSNTSSPSASPPGTWQCYGNMHRVSMRCAA